MIRQIYMDYHLPVMPCDLTLSEAHFFYDALIPGLVEIQKQNKKNKERKGKK